MPTNRDEPRELMAKLIRVWRGSASTRVLQKQASQVRPAREADPASCADGPDPDASEQKE